MDFLSPSLTNAHPHHPSRIEIHQQNSQLSLPSSYIHPLPVPFPQLLNQPYPNSTKLDTTKLSDVFELKHFSSARQFQRPIHNFSSLTQTSPTPTLQLTPAHPNQFELPSLAYGPSTLPAITINNTQVPMGFQYFPMPSSSYSSSFKHDQPGLLKEENKMIKVTHDLDQKKPRLWLDLSVEETCLDSEIDTGHPCDLSDSLGARDFKKSANITSVKKTASPSLSATALENVKGSSDVPRVFKRKITQKRREQNRTHQRAYRERRDLAMKQKDKEIANLTQEIQILRNELTGIQNRWLENSSGMQGHDPITTNTYNNNDTLDCRYVGEPSAIPFGTMKTPQSQQQNTQTSDSSILSPVYISQPMSQYNQITPSAAVFAAKNSLSHRHAPDRPSSLTWPEFYTNPNRPRTHKFINSPFLEDHQVMRDPATSFPTNPLSIIVGGTTISTSQSRPLTAMNSTNSTIPNSSYYEKASNDSGSIRNLKFAYQQGSSSSSSSSYSSSCSSTTEPPNDMLSVGNSFSPSSHYSGSPH